MDQSKIQNFLKELPQMREDLPFSPEILQQLFVQTSGYSYASLEDVGVTLSRDQGLTTRILSLANSAYYGLQAEVQSVPRAAAVLGMSEIRNIVLALGVNGLAKAYDMPEEFTLEAYWLHQFKVGAVAKELSRITDIGKPDNLFTAGLLHDIGKLITALKRPFDWAAIQDLAETDDMQDNEAEEAYWGMDHAVVGALVLNSWDLPVNLVEPVNWHHSPALAPQHSGEATLVSLANAVVHVMEDPDSAYMVRVEDLCHDMDVEFDDLMEFAEELVESDDIEQFVKTLS
ncbi:HDOD domain-containing protein [Pseudodesulfovibrio sediminis]|uniref:HD family phosphohydrolase n=1 Tax=Pseudodesulfovibrio sediminis TaxID=2810563 RepID=A0ABN6EV83_9BACT|nr:HDOD domain-containing protein [Pseudodesulfovibrio sediminis]BCS90196.1 HD family phosphohydrolase [Pseudodesulfovibrio sediminis]